MDNQLQLKFTIQNLIKKYKQITLIKVIQLALNEKLSEKDIKKQFSQIQSAEQYELLKQKYGPQFLESSANLVETTDIAKLISLFDSNLYRFDEHRSTQFSTESLPYFGQTQQQALGQQQSQDRSHNLFRNGKSLKQRNIQQKKSLQQQRQCDSKLQQNKIKKIHTQQYSSRKQGQNQKQTSNKNNIKTSQSQENKNAKKGSHYWKQPNPQHSKKSSQQKVLYYTFFLDDEMMESSQIESNQRNQPDKNYRFKKHFLDDNDIEFEQPIRLKRSHSFNLKRYQALKQKLKKLLVAAYFGYVKKQQGASFQELQVFKKPLMDLVTFQQFYKDFQVKEVLKADLLNKMFKKISIGNSQIDVQKFLSIYFKILQNNCKGTNDQDLQIYNQEQLLNKVNRFIELFTKAKLKNYLNVINNDGINRIAQKYNQQFDINPKTPQKKEKTTTETKKQYFPLKKLPQGYEIKTHQQIQKITIKRQIDLKSRLGMSRDEAGKKIMLNLENESGRKSSLKKRDQRMISESTQKLHDKSKKSIDELSHLLKQGSSEDNLKLFVVRKTNNKSSQRINSKGSKLKEVISSKDIRKNSPIMYESVEKIEKYNKQQMRTMKSEKRLFKNESKGNNGEPVVNTYFRHEYKTTAPKSKDDGEYSILERKILEFKTPEKKQKKKERIELPAIPGVNKSPMPKNFSEKLTASSGNENLIINLGQRSYSQRQDGSRQLSLQKMGISPVKDIVKVKTEQRNSNSRMAIFGDRPLPDVFPLTKSIQMSQKMKNLESKLVKVKLQEAVSKKNSLPSNSLALYQSKNLQSLPFSQPRSNIFKAASMDMSSKLDGTTKLKTISTGSSNSSMKMQNIENKYKESIGNDLAEYYRKESFGMFRHFSPRRIDEEEKIHL